MQLRQDWVELAPFELHRLCGDCRDHRGDSSAEARGFLLSFACHILKLPARARKF